MIKEFQAFFTLFQKGKELTNAATWKNRTIAANALTAVLGAALVIANGYGYKIELDQTLIESLSAGIVAAYGVVNVVMHVITSSKVGVGPKLESPTDEQPPQE